jgi:hypothetical protein
MQRFAFEKVKDKASHTAFLQNPLPAAMASRGIMFIANYL